EGHTKIIKIFEDTQFKKKYNALEEKYRNNKKVFNEKKKILALSCVDDLLTIEDPFIGQSESSSEEGSDSGSFIEGEDDFSEDGSEISSSSEETITFNTRKQSVDDLIEHIYNE